MNVDRRIRELDHPSLGLRRGWTVAIKWKGRKEIVDGERFPVASQMKEDGIRGRSIQVALADSPGNWINSRLRRVMKGCAHSLHGRENPVV